MHILCVPREEAEALSKSILEMKDSVRLCSICYTLSDEDICRVCSDPSRDETIICVIEQPADMVAVEKSGAFSGLYHILQGALSPMHGIGPDDIRLKELIGRVENQNVKEVVLATATNVEGESTASYIADQLRGYDLKITRIASGVPMGGDLKYVDQVTLKIAMETRHNV
jgi:recombination protein RecR